MTERTKTIKRLISGQVDMGTFGLVELELLAIEKEMESLRNNAGLKSVCQCGEGNIALHPMYLEKFCTKCNKPLLAGIGD